MNGSELDLHIVVVDDDPSFRELLATLLTSAGYAVVSASTATEALDAVRATRPAAVILDVALPDTSGYDVCRELRAEWGDELPIVFVSGERIEPLDRIAGLLLGADDYLLKPFVFQELVARVRLLVSRRAPVREVSTDVPRARESASARESARARESVTASCPSA